MLLTGFVAVERRISKPLIPLTIYRVHNLRIANGVMACVGVLLTAILYFLSLYLQQVLGYSAMRAGLAMLPLSVTLVLGTFVSRRLILVFTFRQIMTGGMVIAAGGLAWLSFLPVHPAFAGHVLGPMLIVGTGLSLANLPVTVAATSEVAPQDAGVAGGLVNMGRQLGGAIGLSILVTAASLVTRHSAGAGGGHNAGDTATVNGYRAALLITVSVSLLAAAIGSRVHNTSRPR